MRPSGCSILSTARTRRRRCSVSGTRQALMEVLEEGDLIVRVAALAEVFGHNSDSERLYDALASGAWAKLSVRQLNRGPALRRLQPGYRGSPHRHHAALPLATASNTQLAASLNAQSGRRGLSCGLRASIRLRESQTLDGGVKGGSRPRSVRGLYGLLMDCASGYNATRRGAVVHRTVLVGYRAHSSLLLSPHSHPSEPT